MLFYLGTHHPHWLSRTGVPLFVSAPALRLRKSLGRSVGRWALDSGGFTELDKHGRWTVSPWQYAMEARRWAAWAGRKPDWCAPQDWMCEERILAKTGLSVREHQERTIHSVIDLRNLEPDFLWVPVLQGWTMMDYLEHVKMYARAGIDLTREKLVGLGSVCRRQGTAMVEELIRKLCAMGLKLHGFGLKTKGLENIAGFLDSSDSLSWSFTARRRKIRLPGHPHINCANCLEYALQWRGEIMEIKHVE